MGRNQTMSDLAVKLLQQADPRVQVGGYARAVRGILDSDMWNDNPARSVRPDAYLIDHDLREVVTYEVEDKHPMPVEKIEKYIELFWDLDEGYWTLRLFALDRYGKNKREIDLLQYEVAIYGEVRMPRNPWRVWEETGEYYSALGKQRIEELNEAIDRAAARVNSASL